MRGSSITTAPLAVAERADRLALQLVRQRQGQVLGVVRVGPELAQGVRRRDRRPARTARRRRRARGRPVRSEREAYPTTWLMAGLRYTRYSSPLSSFSLRARVVPSRSRMIPRGTVLRRRDDRRVVAASGRAPGALTTAQYPPAPARAPKANDSTSATCTIVRPSGRRREEVASIRRLPVGTGGASRSPRWVAEAARPHDRTGPGAARRRRRWPGATTRRSSRTAA